jgi:transmembrane sensor
METLPTIREQIAAEADEWLLKLQTAGPAQGHRDAFTDWLMQSPTHIEAYLAVSRAWHALAMPNQDQWSEEVLIAAARGDSGSGNVIPLREADRPRAFTERPPGLRLSMRRWAARVAVLSLVAVAAAWLLQGYRSSANDIRTTVGEQRSVTLADGSVVFLNTNSELKVQWTKNERHIDLLRGEARFQVAKNSARPFVVATQEARVRAVGTVFNIRTGEATTQVAVLEGRVEVNAIPRVREENNHSTQNSQRPAAHMTADG